MSKKKFALLMFFSFVSTQALGFKAYLGAGAGMGAIDFKQNATIVRTNTFDVIDRTRLSGTGAYGNFFLGCSWAHKHFYLGLEPRISVGSIKFHSSNDDIDNNNLTETTYQVKNNAAVSLLPGILFGNTTLFYGSLGYDNGNFEIITTDTSLRNLNKRISGFHLGFGVLEKLNRKLALKLECKKIFYEEKSIFVVDGTTTKETNITPQSIQASLNLQYQFSG